MLVVNTCSGIESFDLKVTLDPSFDTNPSNNPGNAIITYLAGDIVDPYDFDISAFGGGMPQGQMLCLSNISLADGSSFLAPVHMGIRRGIHQADLTTDPGGFSFLAELYGADTGCAGTPLESTGANLSYSIR